MPIRPGESLPRYRSAEIHPPGPAPPGSAPCGPLVPDPSITAVIGPPEERLAQHDTQSGPRRAHHHRSGARCRFRIAANHQHARATTTHRSPQSKTTLRTRTRDQLRRDAPAIAIASAVPYGTPDAVAALDAPQTSRRRPRHHVAARSCPPATQPLDRRSRHDDRPNWPPAHCTRTARIQTEEGALDRTLMTGPTSGWMIDGNLPCDQSASQNAYDVHGLAGLDPDGVRMISGHIHIAHPSYSRVRAVERRTPYRPARVGATAASPPLGPCPVGFELRGSSPGKTTNAGPPRLGGMAGPRSACPREPRL